MVGSPPDLPASVKTKIAVLYADGNKFTQIRAALAAEGEGVVQAQKLFSSRLRTLQRDHLLPALLRPLIAARDAQALDEDDPELADRIERRRARAALTDECGEARLRLETLMWGGDEILIVAPAWLGLELARAFMDEVNNDRWAIGGHRQTFSAGLVIGSYKTPIRTLKQAARGLCDDVVKAAGAVHANKMSVEVFESVEPPGDGIASHRARLLNAPRSDVARQQFDARFVFDAPAFRAAHARIRALKEGNGKRPAFPRSQLARLVREARRADAFATLRREVDEMLSTYLSKAGDGAGLEQDDLRLATGDALKGRPLSLDVFLIDHLWDFVSADGDDLLGEIAP